ncbi:MAG: hypothetical protein Kow0059_03940 [Candidatus Sumerlaeia bacterium]
MERKRIGFGGWRLIGVIVAAAWVVMAEAPSAELLQTGRAKLGEIGDAVVTVKIVSSVKVSWSGQPGEENEMKNEARGTVVSPDGVTIVSLAEIDPAQFWQNMMGGRMGEEVRYETSLKDIRLLLSNGTEIPAEVVLRDHDLDVAVVRPRTRPEQPMTFVDLKQSAGADYFDPIICISRMGMVGQRQLRVMTGEIQGIVKKPRLYYVPVPAADDLGPGVPVFNAEGKVIGLLLMKSVPSSADSSSNTQDSYMTIILPADDIQQIVAQAPERGAKEPGASVEGSQTAAPDAKGTEKKQTDE